MGKGRNKSFDELLSKQLRNPEFARGYIFEAMRGEDALTIEEVLFEMIQIIGIKEYAELVGMQASNVTRMLSSGEIPKIETINRLLAPFGLKAKIDVEEVA